LRVSTAFIGGFEFVSVLIAGRKFAGGGHQFILSGIFFSGERHPVAAFIPINHLFLMESGKRKMENAGIIFRFPLSIFHWN
jgi:hypothetical protein